MKDEIDEMLEGICMGKYEELGTEIGKLVDAKNQSYGDSFNQCERFLKILWPDGVPPDKYADMLAIVRIFDKIMRIAHQKDAFGESPFRDIAGYAILGMERGEHLKQMAEIAVQQRG